MNGLLAIAVSNLVVASLIALLALLADRLVRRPALTHGLWLLFFIKLLTPPVLPVHIAWTMPTLTSTQDTPARTGEANPISEPQAKSALAETPIEARGPSRIATMVTPAAPLELPLESSRPLLGDADGVRSDAAPREALVHVRPLAKDSLEPITEADRGNSWPWIEMALGLWLTGSLAWFSLAAVRLWRFRRQLRLAAPASESLCSEAARFARRLGVSCPGVWILPGALSPMLWVLGRTPRLLLPADLLRRLDDEQRQALLVHELAHWRRRDHWVRWLELAALGLYWWCPVAWWARRHLQEAEEECCDAWVVWLMPGAARGYALALVETVDFLAGAGARLPPVASGVGQVRLLRRRLTMIMRGRTEQTLTFGGAAAVLGVAAVLLPLMPIWAQPDVAAQHPAAPTAQAFPRGPYPPATGVAQAPTESQDSIATEQQRLARTAAELQRMQADLNNARQELERRSMDLQQKMEAIQRQAAALSRRLAQMAKRGDGQSSPNPGTGGFGGGGGGRGGFVGPGGFPGGGFAPGNNLADIDQRLQRVEHKLDMLIQMMQKGSRPFFGGAPTIPPPPAPPENRSVAPQLPTPAQSTVLETPPIDPLPPIGAP